MDTLKYNALPTRNVAFLLCFAIVIDSIDHIGQFGPIIKFSWPFPRGITVLLTAGMGKDI